MPKLMPKTLVAIITATILLTGCSSAPSGPTEQTSTGTQAITPSATPEPSEAPEPTETAAELGPEETFRAWLTASRKPDAPLACSYMSAELQQKILTEISQSLATVASCEEMIEQTAAAYALSESSTDVDVQIVSESAAEATIFATYLGSGKCGTIVLAKRDGSWIMTDQVEECAAG